MELSILDPFEDYQTAGYLRNRYKEKNLKIVGHLESSAYERHVHWVMRGLRRLPNIDYACIKDTHRRLFRVIYPWAGDDRLQNAPDIKIVKAGYNNLFAHPPAIRIAADYALSLARDKSYLREHPGVVFGYLAHAHPFLEGNGRTILTIYAELCRRAGFSIEWEAIEKQVFLRTLTEELQRPATSLDQLLLQYLHPGALSIHEAVARLRFNFNREA